MSLNPDPKDLQQSNADSRLDPDATLDPRPELALDATKDHVEDPQIAIILDRHLEDLQNGIACSRQQLLDRHPKFADALAEYLDGIEMVAGLKAGSDLVPQQVGDFDVSDVIGQGGMGVVYRAYQKSLKRPVALKVLRYAITGQQASKRFEREAELVATLDHPNIVPVYAYGQHEELNFFAMRLIDGESLAQWNADDPPQRDPNTIATWGAEVARALAHAHQRDVVHRDVKPSNLLKDNSGKIWLTDFGLARRFDDVRMSMTGAMLGTPNYMSPEQAAPARHPIDHRADVYSLGATLFELLTGRTVFPADTPHAVLAQVLTAEAPLLSDLVPGAHRDLETIVMKCLEKEPRDRYQTALELAEDLEAFVAGNPIRGRRPGAIERFARWRKQNNKTVRWAGAAAAATLTLLAVSVAAWLGWRNATTGHVLIQSDQGPIVGRLIDADGNKTPTFTIPMQQRMSVKEGRYRLQTWAKNRVGQTQDMFVTAGNNKKIQIKLPDMSLFPDRTIEGTPKRWRQTNQAGGKSDGIVLFQANGIARLNPVNGKEMWSIDSEQLTAISKSESAARKKLEGGKQTEDGIGGQTWEQALLKPFSWNWNRRIQSESDSRIPRVAAGFPDINDDRQPDLLVAASRHPTLISLDGTTGRRLWRYTSLPNHEDPQSRYLRYRSGGMNKPMVVADIDGDGFDDITAQFCDHSVCWIDAVSSKTGKQLWRIEMPEEWFDVAKTGGQTPNSVPVLPRGCQLQFEGSEFRYQHETGTDWKYFGGLSARGQKKDLMIPWQSSMLPIEESESGLQIAGVASGNTSDSLTANSLMLTVCGSRLVGHDVATGKLSPAFNHSQPLDLGYFPALQPRLVRNDDGQLMGLLLCEIVSLADCGNWTKPVTRFHLLSLDTAKPIWSFTTDCDPDWTGVSPDWPLIEDLNGDGTPEIVVAGGAQLENAAFARSAAICTLQAIDGATGKAIWDQTQLPMLRCMSHQIQNVLIGPDADGDQLDDVYAICPMGRRFASSDPSSVFIDVLSGVSGQKIRTVECACPIWRKQIELQKPFFWGVSPDGSPQLVLSSFRSAMDSVSGTLFVSTGNGDVNHIADGLSVRLQMPYRRTSSNTLFLTAPRNEDHLTGASDWVTLKPQPRACLNLTGDYLVPSVDFDGDGLSDLLSGTTESDSPTEIRAISGRDGKELWKHAFKTGGGNSKVQDIISGEVLDREIGGHSKVLDTDLDGDQIKDVLVWGGKSYLNPITLTCLSGRSGKPLWSKPFACVRNDFLRVISRPVGDGGSDVYIIYKKQSPTCSLQLLCLDGKTGDQRSEVSLVSGATGGGPGRAIWVKPNTWPLLVGDYDSDGNTEMISVSYDNAGQHLSSWRQNGEVNWQTPLAQTVPRNLTPRLNYIEGAGDSGLIAFVDSTENNTNAPSTSLVRWFDAKEGRLAANWLGPNDVLDPQSYSQDKPAILTGFPFAIRDHNRTLTGVCCRRDRGSSRLRVHVLDPRGGEPQNVCQIDVERQNLTWNIEGTNPKFLIADVDGNGQDELIHCRDEHIIATTLATGKERLRYKFAKPGLGLIGLTKDSKHIELIGQISSSPSGSVTPAQLMLLDLKTLKPSWSVELRLQATYGRFIAPLQSAQVGSTEPVVEPPLVGMARRGIRQSELLVSQASGDQDQVAGVAAGTVLTDSTTGLAKSQDPRWLKRVPWSTTANEIVGSNWVSDLLQSLAVCLGAVVFPILFVRRMLKHKRWSLKETLLLPLLFVVPYMALQLNIGTEQFNVSDNLEVGTGIQSAAIQMLTSLIILPSIVFYWFGLKSLWRGQWWRLVMIAVFLIVIGVVVGSWMILIDQLTAFSAGSRYEWWDWSHLLLFRYGAMPAGFLLIVFYISRYGYRFIVSWLENRKPALQTAS